MSFLFDFGFLYLFFKLGQTIDSSYSLISVRLDIKQVDGQYVYTEKGKLVYPKVLEYNQDEILNSLIEMGDSNSFWLLNKRMVF